ncbi:MAG: hypothetical protein JNJ40_01425 [Bacteroidia bacterium]|nr:hypothetical protein [Bacteroidia bacterium]
METIISQQTSKTQKPKAFLVVIATFFGVLALIGFILHLSPLQMADTLADFAAHHYFLFAFVCLILAVLSFRYYLIMNEQLISGNQRRSQIGYSRKKRRHAIISNLVRTFDHHVSDSEYIAKEKIQSLKFDQEDVINDTNLRNDRDKDLYSALHLGNLYKQKVIISFKDTTGLKHTFGTVWHVDNENICLKSGITIPVKNITKIEF